MEREIKILIVEDDVISSLYWSRSLRKMNYKKIHSVVSGESAIEYSKIEKPDLILMDIELGGKLNGLETASLIKTFCDAKIIFITSYPDNEFLNKLQSFNSSKYLIKPVSIDNIVNIIGRL